jgi:hypothetical protein
MIGLGMAMITDAKTGKPLVCKLDTIDRQLADCRRRRKEAILRASRLVDTL